MEGKTMKAYKGFNKDMSCRGFQYEESGQYHQDQAKCCSSGFHACQHPLDCLSYYPPASSAYHEVVLSGKIDANNKSDSKVAATDIKIGRKLDIAGLVKAAIEFVSEKTNKMTGATGFGGASSATGDYGASSATGNRGASSATGDYGSSEAGNSSAVAIAWGRESKARGVIGAHLVVAEWELNNGDNWNLKGAKMVRVDGEIIKADTWYTLKNGEFAEVEE